MYDVTFFIRISIINVLIVLHLFVYKKQFLFCYFEHKICKFGIFSISKYFCSWLTFLIIFSKINLFQTIFLNFSQQIFSFCISLLSFVPYEPSTTLEPHVSLPPELTLGEAVCYVNPTSVHRVNKIVVMSCLI